MGKEKLPENNLIFDGYKMNKKKKEKCSSHEKKLSLLEFLTHIYDFVILNYIWVEGSGLN